MAEIHDKIIKLLKDNSIDYSSNISLATAIKNLVAEYSEPQKAISLVRLNVLSKDNMKKGGICPACTQNVKMYEKKIDSQMAYYLIQIYKKTISFPDKEYFHVQDDLNVPMKVSGSWAKLRWWGLIEEQEKGNDVSNKRTSGMWKITDAGKRFVQHKSKVTQYVKLFNGKFYGEVGKQVNISQCLNEKFNYMELMNH